ncbi:Polysaccharide deacetylase [Phaffia rhodozyma]|uniref:chitin deacetylase n=1 Tax=Phaffia rhodozyma TaxID=264483 RepID=A0A0F7SFQ4_PHARH|nr:Polysaccharide deacetylase [Phaffia rhodozyma]
MQGHEIAGHTWSHMPLTTLTNEEIVAELGWTKQLIKDIIGVETLTFRPPQGDMDNRVRAIASQMNLTPVMWTGVGSNGGDLFDTQDFEVAAGLINSTQAFSQWTTFLDTNIPKIEKGFLTLEHDLHAVTVNLAVYYYLPEAMNRTNPTLSLKTVMECNGRSIGEAYKETAQNITTSAVASSSASASAASVSASTSASAVSGSSTRSTAPSASASASSGPVSGAIWGTSVSAGLVGAVVALVGTTALVL